MLAPTTAGRSTLLGIIGMALLQGVATTMHQEALRLHGPAPAAAPPIADTPPSADAAADASGREGGAARWEHDHGDGPQPVALLDENGVRRIARVAGPLLPSGRFEASSSSSSSDSADDEEDDHEDIADDAVCSPDHGQTSAPKMKTRPALPGPRPPWFWKAPRWHTPKKSSTPSTDVNYKTKRQRRSKHGPAQVGVGLRQLDGLQCSNWPGNASQGPEPWNGRSTSTGPRMSRGRVVAEAALGVQASLLLQWTVLAALVHSTQLLP